MTLNKLSTYIATAMLEAAGDNKIKKGEAAHFTDPKKKKKRKAERAARRKNRK